MYYLKKKKKKRKYYSQWLKKILQSLHASSKVRKFETLEYHNHCMPHPYTTITVCLIHIKYYNIWFLTYKNNSNYQNHEQSNSRDCMSLYCYIYICFWKQKPTSIYHIFYLLFLELDLKTKKYRWIIRLFFSIQKIYSSWKLFFNRIYSTKYLNSFSIENTNKISK